MVYDFDEISSKHNWSKDKMISVYEDFIYENDLDESLGTFAAEVAKAENEAIHYPEEDDFDYDDELDEVYCEDVDNSEQVSEDWLHFQW